MSVKDMYLREYKESSWTAFVALFQEEYGRVKPQLKEKARQQGIPEDIGTVLLSEMGEYLFKWLGASVPALDHAKPADLLRDEDGIKALKAAILRMSR